MTAAYSDLGAAQTVHGLLELRVAALHLARQIKLLPLNGHVQAVKDLLDRVRDLLSDTVTGDQCRRVHTTILGRALRTSELIYIPWSDAASVPSAST